MDGVLRETTAPERVCSLEVSILVLMDGVLRAHKESLHGVSLCQFQSLF